MVEEYEENAYGESSSPLHHGAPTDRFVAEWRITAAHVERRIASMNRPLVRDARVMAAPVVNPSGVLEQTLVPGDVDLTCDEPRLLVEIPTHYDKTLVRDPALALEWRLSTRAIFESYFARGYRAVDFLLSRSAGRGQYLLALPSP